MKTAYAIDVPGDGTCMFHAIGLPLKINGHKLRSLVAEFIEKNPDIFLHDQPLKKWIEWDEGMDAKVYAKSIKEGKWGGSLETTILASLLGVTIHVYEPRGELCSRISESKPDKSIDSINLPYKHLCILYTGKSHYMGLEVS